MTEPTIFTPPTALADKVLPPVISETAAPPAIISDRHAAAPALQPAPKPKAHPFCAKIEAWVEDPPFKCKIVEKDGQRRLDMKGEDKDLQTVMLLRSLGCPDDDFANAILAQVANACANPDRQREETATNAVFAVINAMKPRDPMEAMLLAQAGVLNERFMRAVATASNHGGRAEIAANYTSQAVKLTRAYSGLMETLKRYRHEGGQQKVEVKHVHVNAGGQAIVGVVESGREGGGGRA